MGNVGNRGNIIEKAKQMMNEGWNIRIKTHRGKLYVSARRMENGRRVEKGLGYASPEEAEEIKKLTAAYITTTQTSRKGRKAKKREKFGKGGRGFLSGFELLRVFRVHRLGLRFDVAGKRVSVPLLYGLPGDVSFEPRSKQYVVRLGVGVKRVVTLQVNRDGSAQVFLECSDNPMDFFEFVGFCRFWLLDVFSRVTGAVVGLEDFEVMVAPELNVDLPGVVVSEGGKCLTLKDFYDGLVARIYGVEPGKKESMPGGGTRVEAVANNLQGENLKDMVDGVVSVALLPKTLKKLERDLEQIKGSLTSVQVLGNEVAAKLGNLWYATFERFRDSLVEGIKEGLKQAIKDAIKEAVGEIRRDVEKAVKRMTFRDLPEDLQWALKQFEEFGYIRVREDRVEYGDRVWSAIKRYHGNIDGWLEWEAQGWVGKLRDIFKDVIGTIRYFDNKYEGKTGVPYDKFLEEYQRRRESKK